MSVEENGRMSSDPSGPSGSGERSRLSSIESCEDSQGLRGIPSSRTLLVRMAEDYSLYMKTDLSVQISKVEEFVEESIAKLEEFQSLFRLKENEWKTWTTHILPDLVRTGALLALTLNQRLDSLAFLIGNIQSALDVLEAHISEAESKLGVHAGVTAGIAGISTSTSTAIKSVFKSVNPYKYFYKAEESASDPNLVMKSKGKASVNLQQLKGPDPLDLNKFFHEGRN